MMNCYNNGGLTKQTDINNEADNDNDYCSHNHYGEMSELIHHGKYY